MTLIVGIAIGVLLSYAWSRLRARYVFVYVPPYLKGGTIRPGHWRTYRGSHWKA